MSGMDHMDKALCCIFVPLDLDELHLVTKATVGGVGCGTESVRFEISPAPEFEGIQHVMFIPLSYALEFLEFN